MTGRLITLEGGEGTGKSTQAARLVERLRGAGLDVVATREPGGTEGAEAVRALLVTGDAGRWSAAAEACLVNAARADHVERVIRPALDGGAWVVSDRFVDSTLAYQGAGKGLADSALRSLHHIAAADLWPDLTLVLDLPEGGGLARAEARGGGRFEAHDADFHTRVLAGFREIVLAEPGRCKLVDASGDVDAVAARLWAEVELLLTPKRPLESDPSLPPGRSPTGADSGDD